MARRKRASMREGPLADLFRSTSEEEDAHDDARQPEEEEETREVSAAAGEEGTGQVPEPDSRTPASTEPEEEPVSADLPEGGDVSVYRSDEAPGPPPELPRRESKDRLRHLFSDEERDEGPAFGREEPDPSRPAAPTEAHQPVIRVVGVGGAGVNAINRMIEADVGGVEFIAINTDLQSLQQSAADLTVHIGGGLTHGLGSGSDPELGYRAAFAEQDKIKRLLKGSDMVFVTAGVGGGTGTGATPVVARLARDVGALTVGIVTKPFSFEGTRRGEQGQRGVDALAGEVDTLIVVPNENLLSVLARNTSMVEAFQVADDVLRQGVQGIVDLITLPSIINLDFADVRTTMRDAGPALLGIGMGNGDRRSAFAAEQAISSPLLETSVEGARSILLSVTGGTDLSLVEVSEAARVIQEAAHPEAHIIFGANVDETLDQQVWVTVIATRFDGRGRRADGSSSGVRRDVARPSSRRPNEVRPGGGVPGYESKPRELGIDVPEFLPR